MPDPDAITQTYIDTLKAASTGSSWLPLTGDVGEGLLARVREEGWADFLAVNVAVSTGKEQLNACAPRSMPPALSIRFDESCAGHLGSPLLAADMREVVEWEVVSNHLNRFIVETVCESAGGAGFLASDHFRTLAVDLVDGHYAHSTEDLRICLAQDVYRAYCLGAPYSPLDRAQASGVDVRCSEWLDPGTGVAVRASPSRPPGMWIWFPESLPITGSRREGGSLTLRVGGSADGFVLPRHPGMYTKFTIATDAGE